MGLTPAQWMTGIIIALIVGVTKTGIPGLGILITPLMAVVFGGRLGVGATLPMLIFGDIFAVLWYRRHARWDHLRGLLPWALTGIAIGTGVLWLTGTQGGTVDWLNIIIGVLVLLMLGIIYARRRWGDKRLVPPSRVGLAGTGTLAGFSSTASNAAGPIVSIYLTGAGLPKNEFMGTTAWIFFIFNLTKLPIYGLLSLAIPDKPMVSTSTLIFDVIMLPIIIGGIYFGKWLLPRIRQEMFDNVVLILAGLTAAWLIIQQIH
jgi:uncharacterized protein